MTVFKSYESFLNLIIKALLIYLTPSYQKPYQNQIKNIKGIYFNNHHFWG